VIKCLPTERGIMSFKNQKWNYFDKGEFDKPIASIVCEGITVTAVSAPGSTIISEDKPYDFIELPGGLECLVVISADYIQEILAKSESSFSKGFALGMFVDYVLRDKMKEMLDCEYESQ